VIIWTYDVAPTGDEPAKVKAVITEDDEQAHAEVARELADRPAVRTIHQRLTGFNFRA
jgi:hypothetical protein